MAVAFAGGVHPPGSKGRTQALAVKEVAPPEALVVPLLQHTGAPATPVVRQGDRVLKGGLLGEPAGYISAAVHSPVSGEVVAVEPRLLPIGRRGLSVVIRNDGQDRWADGCNAPCDTSRLSCRLITYYPNRSSRQTSARL